MTGVPSHRTAFCQTAILPDCNRWKKRQSDSKIDPGQVRNFRVRLGKYRDTFNAACSALSCVALRDTMPVVFLQEVVFIHNSSLDLDLLIERLFL